MHFLKFLFVSLIFPEYISNCTLPDNRVASGAIDSLTTAINQAICHSECLEIDDIVSQSERSVCILLPHVTLLSFYLLQMFAGYPIWTQAYTSFLFSQDGIHGLNCLLRGNPNNCQVPASPAECPANLNPVLALLITDIVPIDKISVCME